MKIYKAIQFPFVTKAFSIAKPILDENGNPVRDLYITDDCELYTKDEWENKNFTSEMTKAPININKDENNRLYAALNDNSSCPKRTQHLARIARRAFDEPKFDDEFYKTHQVDHINPSIPVSNNILNLEWVTPQENMRRAGINRLMEKEYQISVIEKICDLLSQGYSNSEVANKLGVRTSLVYDISIGKTHKYISEKYINNGFEYKDINSRDKEAREKAVEDVCKLLNEEKYYTNKQLAEMSGNIFTDKDITNIKRGITYKYISEKYNIDYDKYKKS